MNRLQLSLVSLSREEGKWPFLSRLFEVILSFFASLYSFFASFKNAFTSQSVQSLIEPEKVAQNLRLFNYPVVTSFTADMQSLVVVDTTKPKYYILDLEGNIKKSERFPEFVNL